MTDVEFIYAEGFAMGAVGAEKAIAAADEQILDLVA
jgi:FMN-dependent NADH-azoreductase